MLSSSSIQLINNYFNTDSFDCHLIDNSASDRKNYRISINNQSYILTEGNNIEENKSFIYFSELFKNQHIHVPDILTVSQDGTAYLQNDLGHESLYQLMLTKGETPENKKLFLKSISQLINLQTIPHINYNECIDFQVFDEKVVYQDVFYYKYYFLDILGIPYHKRQLIDEIEKIGKEINQLPHHYFLYRDFQSRNIFIKDDMPYFIDYQGGMKGFPAYDLVSLIWQAKIQLSSLWKQEFKDYYFKEFHLKTGEDYSNLENSYRLSLIIRFLQLLGAYGLRGIVQKKSHFKESIFHHFLNLEYLLTHQMLYDYPEIQLSVQNILSPETKDKLNKIL